MNHPNDGLLIELRNLLTSIHLDNEARRPSFTPQQWIRLGELFTVLGPAVAREAAFWKEHE